MTGKLKSLPKPNTEQPTTIKGVSIQVTLSSGEVHGVQVRPDQANLILAILNYPPPKGLTLTSKIKTAGGVVLPSR